MWIKALLSASLYSTAVTRGREDETISPADAHESPHFQMTP
jgi:hypothetical protein